MSKLALHVSFFLCLFFTCFVFLISILINMFFLVWLSYAISLLSIYLSIYPDSPKNNTKTRQLNNPKTNSPTTQQPDSPTARQPDNQSPSVCPAVFQRHKLRVMWSISVCLPSWITLAQNLSFLRMKATEPTYVPTYPSTHPLTYPLTHLPTHLHTSGFLFIDLHYILQDEREKGWLIKLSSH